MGLDDNKEIIRKFFEQGWGERDAAVFDEVLAPGYVRHSAGAVSDGAFDCREALSRSARGLPDYKIKIEHLIAEDDLVVIRTTCTGTHLGPYLGFEPTGRSVKFTTADVYRLSGGKIVESWHHVDEHLLRTQIGAP